MDKLTAAKVRAITGTGLHGDGGTLYLSVAPGGSKSWVQRRTVYALIMIAYSSWGDRSGINCAPYPNSPNGSGGGGSKGGGS